jgi:hypothetical protein
MRYEYSTIRFVPKPETGEFINVGVLMTDPWSNDWRLKRVENLSRAESMTQSAPIAALLVSLERIQQLAEVQLQINEESQGQPDVVDRGWLVQLHQEHRSVVQFSPPAPISSENLDSAIDRVFQWMVEDPQRQTRNRVRDVLARDMKAEFRNVFAGDLGHALRVGRTVENKLVRAKFDVAVGHDAIVELAQSWNLASPPESTWPQLNSWILAAEQLRHKGGSLLNNAEVVVVPPDVEIKVAYTAPDPNSPDIERMSRTLELFQEMGIEAVPWTNDAIARLAIAARNKLEFPRYAM